MAKKMTRRDFIKSGTGTIAALGAAAGSLPLFGKTPAASTGNKTKVVLARNERAVNNRNVCNQEEVTNLFNKALFSLTGKNSAETAWASLGLTAKDVVAVKVNCNTWTIHLSPHQELVFALCQSLNSTIPLNNIIFYERTTSDLESGGFKANTSGNGVRYFGNDQGGGYHPGEKLTRIVTDTCTKLINLASLKCVDGDFGASLFLKNHIGTLEDRDMSKCHGNPDFLAEVSSRPSIKNKTILNLCSGLRGTYKRGVPWYWAGIILGTDPVASEYGCLRVMNKKRRQEGISELHTPPHLEIAEKKYKLGTCNPRNIDLINT